MYSDTVVMLLLAAISSMFSGLMLYILTELLTKKHNKKKEYIMKEKLIKLENLLEDILDEMDDADKDIDTNEFYADLLNLYNSLSHYQ